MQNFQSFLNQIDKDGGNKRHCRIHFSSNLIGSPIINNNNSNISSSSVNNNGNRKKKLNHSNTCHHKMALMWRYVILSAFRSCMVTVYADEWDNSLMSCICMYWWFAFAIKICTIYHEHTALMRTMMISFIAIRYVIMIRVWYGVVSIRLHYCRVALYFYISLHAANSM